MSEAGKVYLFSMQFYDVKSGMMAFKARPALIIYGPRNNDYTVLPVSTIKIRKIETQTMISELTQEIIQI